MLIITIRHTTLDDLENDHRSRQSSLSEYIKLDNSTLKEEYNMKDKEIDKKFVPVLDRVHDEIGEEGYTSVIDEMMPREGESIIESLIRSRHVISEHILKDITDKDGHITPGSIDNIIGTNDYPVFPLVLPDGISNILDRIRSCTRRCNMNDDGHVVYSGPFDPDDCDWDAVGVSDMQTLTHAIVVGNALMLSDPLVTDQDVDNELNEHIDRNSTIIDGINYIDGSIDKIIMWNTHHSGESNSKSISISVYASIICDYKISNHHIDLCMLKDDAEIGYIDITRLGAQLRKERGGQALECMYGEYMLTSCYRACYRDVGVMQLGKLLDIDPVIAIIRYVIELYKDYDNNYIMSRYSHADMVDYMRRIRRLIYSSIHGHKRFIKDIEEYDNEEYDK